MIDLPTMQVLDQDLGTGGIQNLGAQVSIPRIDIDLSSPMNDERTVGIGISPAGENLYVAQSGSDRIVEYDLPALTAVRAFNPQTTPGSITVR